ncbi:MAG: hypothetical protein ABI870_08420, partial [Rhodanobacter sp.]
MIRDQACADAFGRSPTLRKALSMARTAPDRHQPISHRSYIMVKQRRHISQSERWNGMVQTFPPSPMP